MSDNSFIKQNLALILGLALPVLLMAVFMVATIIPKMVIAPPSYNVVFSVPRYNDGQPVAVNVGLHVNKDGILTATYTPLDRDNKRLYGEWYNLYLFNAKTKKVENLDFPIPDDAGAITHSVTRPVAATKGMILSTAATSPDGYSFISNRYGHRRDFMFGFFGVSHASRTTRLVKDGASIPLPVGGLARYPYSSGNSTFIGWVTDKAE
jgi:hypothetical protein